MLRQRTKIVYWARNELFDQQMRLICKQWVTCRMTSFRCLFTWYIHGYTFVVWLLHGWNASLVSQ